jgi:RNA polymerase sigma-70 factor (ECF subfamily)
MGGAFLVSVVVKIHLEPLPESMWVDDNRVRAFEEMYRRCYPHLVDLCRRHLFRRGDPEAVAQEAFVRAWRSLDRFSGVRPFWPWVATIARRLCVDNRRRLDRESCHLHVQAAVCGQEPVLPDELLEIDEEYRSALQALERLKPSERRVIMLRDLNGWSYDEIARFEGVTIESIRGSLKRARASLRKSYARLDASAPVVRI